jgi:glucuronosyltransferase
MSKETLQAFINAFSKLPQRVIWKWEAEIPVNLPSNIMMTKWLPQQDLLGMVFPFLFTFRNLFKKSI